MMLESIDLAAMQADGNGPDNVNIRAASNYTSTSLHEPVKLRVGKQGLAACIPQTIPQFFRECCHKYAQLPALVYERTETDAASGATPATPIPNWTILNYENYEQLVQQSALTMLHLGLPSRAVVALWFVANCPEWYFAELGALCAGGVVAGIYPTSSTEAVYHVLHTSPASVCVVENAEQMLKVRALRERLPHLRAVVQVRGPYDDFVDRDVGYYSWDDLMKRQYDDMLVQDLHRRERDVAVNDCAMLIYTSGTVGMPKAAMLSHDGVVYDAKAVANSLSDIKPGAEVTVTYLPLNHVAAQIFDIFMAIENGGCVYFADHNALKGTLTKTLVKARPTRMFGVPRVFEKIQEKLVAVEANSTPFARYLLQTAREIVQRYNIDIIEGNPLSTWKYWWASKITQQIKVKLGMDRCKSLIVGGAPISDELKMFFLSIDMPLNDIYGLSEGSGAITMHVQLCDLISVGRAFEGIELKIFNPNEQGHGEICIRGRSNFMGYLNDVEKTKETLKEDGWLHSGDVGYLNTNGNLVITGRIKELIITAGGENIPPVHIEEYVKRELPYISNAMVIGDHRKYLTILLTLKTEADPNTGLPLDALRPETIAWLKSLQLSFTCLSEVLNISASTDAMTDSADIEVCPHPAILNAIETDLKRANNYAISKAQRVQKFILLPHDFSLPTEELGPTLKIRRNIVLKKYAKVIDAMYN